MAVAGTIGMTAEREKGKAGPEGFCIVTVGKGDREICWAAAGCTTMSFLGGC